MPSVFCRNALLILLAAMVCQAQAAAPNSAVKASVERLLALGGKTAPSATAELQSLHAELATAAPDDDLVQLARATAELGQRRYREARTLLDAYLKKHPDDVAARVSRVRSSLAEQRNGDTLNDIDVLVRRLAKPTDNKLGCDRGELVRFIGIVLGYLEIVRADQAEMQRRMAIKNQLLESFGETDVAELDAARQDVLEVAQQVNAELDAAKRRLESLDHRQLADTRRSVATAKEQLVDTSEVAQRLQQEASEADREASLLAVQLETLRADRLRVGARYAFLQAEIQAIANQLDNANRRAARGLFDAAGAVAQANNLAFQLAGVNKQALDMDRKILALQNRMAELSGQFEKSAKALEDSDAASREIQRKAKIAEKKLKQKPKTSNARIMALRAQLNNFSTYAPFDYEAEKERVLSLFDD